MHFTTRKGKQRERSRTKSFKNPCGKSSIELFRATIKRLLICERALNSRHFKKNTNLKSNVWNNKHFEEIRQKPGSQFWQFSQLQTKIWLSALSFQFAHPVHVILVFWITSYVMHIIVMYLEQYYIVPPTTCTLCEYKKKLDCLIQVYNNRTCIYEVSFHMFIKHCYKQ